MTDTLLLRDLIKSTLNDASYEVYADEAPDNAKYPYIVFEVSRSSAEIYPYAAYLEINAWDRYKTYSRVDSIMDIVESKLRNEYFSNHAIGFRAYDGDRSHITDTDKAIKRTREKFMIRYSIRY